MNTIHEDHAMRKALHGIYAAHFHAVKACPHAFGLGDQTRMLTGLMGGRRWSWRVVGVTKEALQVFAQHDFQRPPRMLQRGHLISRSSTASVLFDRAEPATLNEFFTVFLERDKTVLMTNSQNAHRRHAVIPDYIPIDLAEQVFPSGTLIGWIHGEAEANCLKRLHAQHVAGVDTRPRTPDRGRLKAARTAPSVAPARRAPRGTPGPSRSIR